MATMYVLPMPTHRFIGDIKIFSFWFFFAALFCCLLHRLRLVNESAFDVDGGSRRLILPFSGFFSGYIRTHITILWFFSFVSMDDNLEAQTAAARAATEQMDRVEYEENNTNTWSWHDCCQQQQPQQPSQTRQTNTKTKCNQQVTNAPKNNQMELLCALVRMGTNERKNVGNQYRNSLPWQHREQKEI